MKTYILLSVLCIFILNTQGQTPPQGYVTLKGRQFYDGNGNPFYPLMMNYEMEYQYDNSFTNHWLNKYWEYGIENDGFENTNSIDAENEIISDLTIIRNIGFNMVRPEFTPKWDPVLKEFYLRGRTYGDPSVQYNLDSDDARTYFDQPYATNQAVLEYFTYMDWFIDQAGQNNMYTMLNGVLGDVTDPDAFIPYKEYLDLLGKHFKFNTWLAFYDIINEPQYVYNYAYSTPQYSKMQACELVAEYYDALKDDNADPNHLVSGGNLVTEDVTLFDPSLLKLDFSQPHLYSESYTTYDNCNLTNKINRIKGSTYWFSKNIPMPWINGETGFPSSDDPQYPKCNDLVCLVAGSNADQQSYAEQILQNTRDSKGSGFVWWVFQDGAWPDHGNALNGYGLLTLETGAPKQAVTTFANYLDPNNNYQPPPASATLPAEPDNYRDPYVNKQFNPNEIGAVTGRVLDETGNGVDNAWVTAKNYLYVDYSLPQPEIVCSWINTYTDPDGYFKIIPLNTTDFMDP
ncbi:MAG: hypothetical protein IPP71_18345 [Bacteroidetes bacterium]|nr:hypothetical protein [Bacteroidota bacterium]